jgi:hypothetical protein
MDLKNSLAGSFEEALAQSGQFSSRIEDLTRTRYLLIHSVLHPCGNPIALTDRLQIVLKKG